MGKDELEAFLLKSVDEAILEEDRCVKITFRISKAEKAKLEKICQGVKISHYIRAILFDYAQSQPRPVVPKINRDTYVELSRISSNLRALSLRQDSLKNYRAQVTELSQIINQVRKAILGIDLQKIDKEN